MADTKISALPASTTPLTGTETLPIVQGGVTKKVSVANLTAGRAVATAGGLFTDNLVQGTAAKGIDFTANTPAAGKTSQLLNWYEEGTWTATLKGGTTDPTTPVTVTGRYTRIGRMVTVSCTFTGVDTTGASGSVKVDGLPFTVKNDTQARAYGMAQTAYFPLSSGYTYFNARAEANQTYMYLLENGSNVASQLAVHSAGTLRYLGITITYEAA